LTPFTNTQRSVPDVMKRYPSKDRSWAGSPGMAAEVTGSADDDGVTEPTDETTAHGMGAATGASSGERDSAFGGESIAAGGEEQR
jgi:hypothetical protein